MWAPVPYILEIAEDISFTNGNNYPSSGTAYSVVLSAGIKYYWRVRREAEPDHWSEVFWFKTALPVVELISPANDAQNIPVGVTFEWSPVAGRLSYSFYLSKDINFSDVIVSNALLSENTFVVEQLESNETYYWKVKAVFTNIEVWSEINSFKTTLSQISLIEPENESTNQPLMVNFKWNDVGAGSYVLEIAEDISFVNKDEYVIEQLTHPALLSPGKTYFWRVRPNNTYEQWSENFSIHDDHSCPRTYKPFKCS